MPKRRFIFIVLNIISVLVLFITAPIYANPCTDSDNDGYAVEGGLCGIADCNDQDNRVYPGAPRLCDGKDNDCDGKNDYTTDVDRDGDGVPWCGGDCNDFDPNRFPGNREGPSGDLTCNDGIDNDCDNRIDFLDTECAGACQDNDGDGYGSPGTASCPNGPVTDCNDNNPLIHAGASDNNCDNIDNDCSGIPDNAYIPASSDCGQGACASTGSIECQAGVLIDTCTPAFPASNDSSCNGIDDDCNGSVDEDYIVRVTTCGLGTCSSHGLRICQYGIETDTCTPGTARSEGPIGALSCNDNVDNDCDGMTDANDVECYSTCTDNDGDGYGNPGDPSCPNGPVTDCNDNEPGQYPGHIEVCDTNESDCRGYVTLTWMAPMTDADGYDLNDLDGYKIYYGAASDNYTETLDIGNNTCHVIGDLIPQEWCFSVTAFDIAGNESEMSNEVCRLIQ